MMKKYMPVFLLGLFLVAFCTTSLVFAQSDFGPPTIIPGDDDVNVGGYGDACIGLPDMIRTGNLHLRQIPCFIKFFSQTLIAIAGTLSVIFVMLGGYRYVLGSDEDKDSAKKTIQYALIGLIVTLMAWIFVDIALPFITE